MKTKSFFIFYTLVNSIPFHAMEHVPLLEKKENYENISIEKIQYIPLRLSFENMRPYFQSPSKKNRYNTFRATKNQNNVPLSNALTFCVATLPTGVPLKIITLMLDNDEKTAEKFYRSPLYYAFYRYDEAKKIIQKLSFPKRPSFIRFFFRLSTEKQQILINKQQELTRAECKKKNAQHNLDNTNNLLLEFEKKISY